MHLKFYWYTSIALWLQTCFGKSCCLIQGDFFKNKNAIVTKICLNHSTILKTYNI